MITHIDVSQEPDQIVCLRIKARSRTASLDGALGQKPPRAGLEALEKAAFMEAGTVLRADTCLFRLLGHAPRPKELRQSR